MWVCVYVCVCVCVCGYRVKAVGISAVLNMWVRGGQMHVPYWTTHCRGSVIQNTFFLFHPFQWWLPEMLPWCQLTNGEVFLEIQKHKSKKSISITRKPQPHTTSLPFEVWIRGIHCDCGTGRRSHKTSLFYLQLMFLL